MFRVLSQTTNIEPIKQASEIENALAYWRTYGFAP